MVQGGEGGFTGPDLGRRLGEAVGGLAYPGDCLVCLGPAGDRRSPLCPDCRSELLGASGPACPRCALPVGPFSGGLPGCGDCSGRALGFDRAVALGPYQGPIRHLCLRLKRREWAWIAPGMVDLLVEARGEAIRGLGASAVVPVPLHWRRRWRRRYDQAEALAVALADRLGLPVARPLRRVRATEALWRLGRAERRRLLRGAFRVDPRRLEGLGLPPRPVLLLVDDILTTGATCGAAARALKAAGVGPVAAVVIGRAE